MPGKLGNEKHIDKRKNELEQVGSNLKQWKLDFSWAIDGDLDRIQKLWHGRGDYLSAASAISPSYTSLSSSADVKLLALIFTATELEHSISKDVVVVRLSSAGETNDFKMVIASPANLEEKDMLLLHSATTAPPSSHEAEPLASSVEYHDSARPEKKSCSDSPASLLATYWSKDSFAYSTSKILIDLDKEISHEITISHKIIYSVS